MPRARKIPAVLVNIPVIPAKRESVDLLLQKVEEILQEPTKLHSITLHQLRTGEVVDKVKKQS